MKGEALAWDSGTEELRSIGLVENVGQGEDGNHADHS